MSPKPENLARFRHSATPCPSLSVPSCLRACLSSCLRAYLSSCLSRENSAMQPAICNICIGMTDRSSNRATHHNGPEAEHLTAAGFAVSFDGAWQTLWYIAAAVLGDRSGAD